MSHFKEHPFHRIIKADARRMSRAQLIEWLTWNDPNGVYNDRDSVKEFGSKISKRVALQHVLRQIQE